MALQIGPVVGTVGGGGDAQIITEAKNVAVSGGSVDVGSFTVDKESLVSVILEHDKPNYVGSYMGITVYSFGESRTPENSNFSASYGHANAVGEPLSLARVLQPGTYSVASIANISAASHTVTKMTVCIVPA